MTWLGHTLINDMLNNVFALHIGMKNYHLKYPNAKGHDVSKFSLKVVTYVDK